MSAIIFAGGKSQRMGSVKADLRLGERSLLEWVAKALEGFGELLVIAPEAPKTLPAGARLITNEPLDGGPLGGLYAGLAAAGEPRSFVSGCDAPFLQPRLAAALPQKAKARNCEGLIPQGAQKSTLYAEFMQKPAWSRWPLHWRQASGVSGNFRGA